MADDETDVVDVEQKPADSPEAGAGQVDYEKRIADTQAWGHQQAQKAAALEQQFEQIKSDPEKQRDFLRDLGYDIDEPDDEQDELDPDELAALRRELQEFKQEYQNTTTQAQQEAENQRKIASWEAQEAREFAEFGNARGVPLSEKEKQAIRMQAVALGERDDGSLPFAEAVAQLDEVWDERQTQWAKSKKTTHRVSAGGKSAVEKPDLSTTAGKTDFIMSRLADSQ